MADFKSALETPLPDIKTCVVSAAAVAAAFVLQQSALRRSSGPTRGLAAVALLAALAPTVGRAWGSHVARGLSDVQDWFKQRRVRRAKQERARRQAAWKNMEQRPRRVSATASPRYDVSDPQMLAHLERHGYVVVKNVMSAAELSTAKSLLWDFLSDSAQMDRNAPETWNDDHFRCVGDTVTGIITGAGFGHSSFCWYVRQRARVMQAFTKVWKTDKLLCSFDGGNVFRPFHSPASVRISKSSGGWYHVDQGVKKPGKHCIQGLVSLYDANAHTGGLCVVPGSHNHHDDLMTYTVQEGDFVPLSPMDPMAEEGRLVCCCAGDLILWDSRTVHCNTPCLTQPTPETGQPFEDLLRAVCYVCMTPKRWATDAVLAERRCAVVGNVGTSHWPHEFFPVVANGELGDVGVRLRVIASSLGGDQRSQAVDAFEHGSKAEAAGDLQLAIRSYKRANKLWPELDSNDDLVYPGLPKDVVAEARRAGVEEDVIAGKAVTSRPGHISESVWRMVT